MNGTDHLSEVARLITRAQDELIEAKLELTYLQGQKVAAASESRVFTRLSRAADITHRARSVLRGSSGAQFDEESVS